MPNPPPLRKKKSSFYLFPPEYVKPKESPRPDEFKLQRRSSAASDESGVWGQLEKPKMRDDKSSDPDKSPKPDKEWPLPNKPVNVFGNAAGASSSGRGSSLLKAPDPRDGRSGDAATPPQDRSATFPGARGPNDKKPRVLRPKKSFKDLQKLVTKSSDALHAMFKKK